MVLFFVACGPVFCILRVTGLMDDVQSLSGQLRMFKAMDLALKCLVFFLRDMAHIMNVPRKKKKDTYTSLYERGNKKDR